MDAKLEKGGNFNNFEIGPSSIFFEIAKDGKIVNNAYKKEERMDSLGRGKFFVPRMIVTNNPDDVKVNEKIYRHEFQSGEIYDEDGYPWPDFVYHTGIEQYCIFPNNAHPIYVFDNHSNALFAWVEAMESGVLSKEKSTVLFRIDGHLDLVYCFEKPVLSRKEIKKAIVKGKVDIKNFTMPAIEEGLVNKMYMMGREENTSLKKVKRTELDEQKMTYNGKEKSEAGNVVNLIKQAKFTDISSFFQSGVIDDFEQKVDEEIARGNQVILDVDFDFFIEGGKTEKEKKLLEAISRIVKKATLSTFATSPGYIKQSKAVEIVHTVLKNL